MRRLCSSPFLPFLCAVAVAYVPAGTAAAAQDLRAAIDAAWSRQPEARAIDARKAESAARQDAASALFPQPPSIAIGQRSDRYHDNRGERETEAEIALPLWMPGTRAAAQRVASAESSHLDAAIRLARWTVAGEVREAYWQARIAHNERELAERKVTESEQLKQDVERRVRAGEMARTDLNQAESAERQARIALGESEVRLRRALATFATLTGLPTLPEHGEPEHGQPASTIVHPRLEAASAAVATRQAQLAQAGAERRDAPELSLGVRRERPAFGEHYDNSVRVAIRIPLATDARNRSRVAAANAELIATETALALERQRVSADTETARARLDQARRMEALALERQRFAADTHALYAKAFRLGELDLPARLRAENERFDAELAVTRARLEVGRAISQLNHALGLLP